MQEQKENKNLIVSDKTTILVDEKKSKKNVWSILGKILAGIVAGFFVLLLICNFYALIRKSIFKDEYPTIFGVGVSVIGSGSMEPALYEGDMVITVRQDEYMAKDIISFKDDIGVVTHRIVEVTENGYITRGDNAKTNNTNDDEIQKSDVFGKVVIIIPKVGTLLEFFKTPWGLVSLGLICICILFIPTLLDKLVEIRKNERSEKQGTTPNENS